jgi:hypothetical protein
MGIETAPVFSLPKAAVGTERADEPPAVTGARVWVRKSVDD